jgi:hypothetical protein
MLMSFIPLAQASPGALELQTGEEGITSLLGPIRRTSRPPGDEAEPGGLCAVGPR